LAQPFLRNVISWSKGLQVGKLEVGRLAVPRPGRGCRSHNSQPANLPTCNLSLLALVAVSLWSPAAARAQEPSTPPEPPLAPPTVQASSAILVDAATGTVLWEKNARVRRPMASTTKIMTATLVLESGRLDDYVSFSEHARATPYANLNAKPGEKFRMRDLLYAIMLRSSNDSCVAAGEHLSGSAWKFAYQMTAKARELGAVDTNFVTTNGLYHPQHYSTAHDLALMTRYAIQYPFFNEIVGSKSATIGRTINVKDRVIKNHNKFLSRYQGADGIKTGYVRQSGKCLVASATSSEEGNPWRLITVVLNSGDTYGDSAALMDWGRKYFQPVFFARRGEQVAVAAVRGGAQANVPLVVAKDLVGIIRREPGKNMEREIRAAGELRAPVLQDQVGGKLVGLVNGQPVAETDLVAAGPVGQVWTAGMMPWTGWSLGLAALLMVPRYARAFAKGARRRRRRVPARRRSPDHWG
jgi:serine-type D-Ala-D-Ala carboxypeptidase (penicillin-binding protein 5/6)